jgi:hypothetical protein
MQQSSFRLRPRRAVLAIFVLFLGATLAVSVGIRRLISPVGDAVVAAAQARGGTQTAAEHPAAQDAQTLPSD